MIRSGIATNTSRHGPPPPRGSQPSGGGEGAGGGGEGAGGGGGWGVGELPTVFLANERSGLIDKRA